MSKIDEQIKFPLTLTWDDGEVEVIEDLTYLSCNVEDFDSSQSPKCRVVDADGRLVLLKVSTTWVERLEYAQA